MTTDHGARDHSVWSASASARNFACAGALRLAHGLPNPESEASAWGTACHQVSEKCLRTGVDAVVFLGTTEITKSRQIEVDDELAETAQTYVDYVRGSASGCTLMIEQRFSLARIDPPFEAGGTGDAVVYDAAGKNLEIVDLKGGQGVVVEAEGNKQLRTYALGAMLANPDLDVETITATIVQPRAPHRDGRIRSETFHVADLMEWTAELLAAMRVSKMAWDDHGAVEATDWNHVYLKPGNHCASTFCPARATCPAVQKASFDAVGLWFDDVTDKPHLHNTPDSLMPEQIAALLDAADMVEGYLNAVRAYAHSQAESGVKIPNYDLYPRQARRKFLPDVTAQTLAEKTGRAPDDFLGDPKLLTPAQAEKVLGKDKDKLNGLWSAESSGTNLCRTDKATRTAVKPKVEQHFDILN